MTDKEKISGLKIRLNTLNARGDKNRKCPGVARKLQRKINKLAEKIDK